MGGEEAHPTQSATARPRPSASVLPVLALVGGADPQDAVTNLTDLKRHFPDSRSVVLPHLGHDFSWDGACDAMLAGFVARGTTKGLDTALASATSWCRRSNRATDSERRDIREHECRWRERAVARRVSTEPA